MQTTTVTKNKKRCDNGANVHQVIFVWDLTLWFRWNIITVEVRFVCSVSLVVLDIGYSFTHPHRAHEDSWNRLPRKKARGKERRGWAFSKTWPWRYGTRLVIFGTFFVAPEFVLENSPSEGLPTKDSAFPSKEINNEWAITMLFCCMIWDEDDVNKHARLRGGLLVVRCTLLIEQSGFEGWGHCVVFLGKALYSHSASLHPGV